MKIVFLYTLNTDYQQFGAYLNQSIWTWYTLNVFSNNFLKDNRVYPHIMTAFINIYRYFSRPINSKHPIYRPIDSKHSISRPIDSKHPITGLFGNNQKRNAHFVTRYTLPVTRIGDSIHILKVLIRDQSTRPWSSIH
jgi:hypothetical protein